jgi:hypothetical protein
LLHDNRAAKFEKVWTTFFNDLVEYKRVHGVSEVPKTDKAYPKVYRWVAQQRIMQKQGSLLVERKEKLIRFGFEFQRIQPYYKKKRYTFACRVSTKILQVTIVISLYLSSIL